MRDGKRNDPYGQFNFLIEIDGVGKGGFSEASGLTTDSNIIEYREGNGNADGQATTRFEYIVELIQELVGLASPSAQKRWKGDDRPRVFGSATCSSVAQDRRSRLRFSHIGPCRTTSMPKGAVY